MTTLYTGTYCNNRNYLHTPLIEIKEPTDIAALQHAARYIGNINYILFTSRYAAKFWAKINGTNELNKQYSPRIVSIGTTTTQTLAELGVQHIEQVEHDDSYGVIEWFQQQQRGRVLIPRSNIALPIIPSGLQALGFDVNTVVAYENHMPNAPQKVDLDNVETIIFTSPSTIDNFIRLYGSLPNNKRLITRGRITQQHLELIIKKQNNNTIQ